MPSVIPLAEQRQITEPFAQGFPFTYSPGEYAGMPPDTFAEVLSYQLDGHPVTRAFHPLGGGEPGSGYQSPVYNPRTKRRHRLNDTYRNDIALGTTRLPQAHATFEGGIVVGPPLLQEPDGARGLVEALTWMHENARLIVGSVGE